ncbi:MAG: DUF4157 domain-containing protein, partial [Heliobacteriaceae bacterium]|nr:DUF4157 domain-containing protein [Heliobacteriaceae bacterium]
LGMGSRGSDDLGSQMRDRIQQQFLRHQIPGAEQEADNLAGSISGVRTPDDVKARLGERMGADFSGVRFHTGADAVGKAERIGARAYTTGNDVYFGLGGFDPAVAAHELVHTAQQGAVSSGTQTIPAPMGEVQMLPKWMSTAWRKIKTAATGIKEFVGGKLGLVGKPSDSEKALNAQKAQRGDYSGTARMAKKDTKRMTEERKADIRQVLGDNPDMTAQQIAEIYGGNATTALDPFNRRALSQLAKPEKGSKEEVHPQTGKVKEAMELMDQKMMIDTMMGPSDEDQAHLKKHYQDYDDQALLQKEYDIAKSGKIYLGSEGGEAGYAETQRLMGLRRAGGQRSDQESDALAQADLAKAQGSGDALLRTMFLMQMGDFQRTDERKGKRKWYKPWSHKKVKESREWDQTMANAFSHGGRTGFIFGATEEGEHGSSDDVADALFGTKSTDTGMGASAGIHVRAAGTHHISMPGKDKGKQGYSEGSGVKAALSAMRDKNYQHFGMDMAIGGIGKQGVAGEGGQGQMINAQGRSGHMYIGRASSTKDTKGGLLMGLESDSPYRMNQTGHMHNAAAMAEEGSSTGGLKRDIQAKKYGGRTVDLSGLKNKELTGILQSFSAHIGAMRADPARADEYKQLVTKMSGKRMSGEDLSGLLGQFMPQQEGETAEERAKRMQELIRRSHQVQ